MRRLLLVLTALTACMVSRAEVAPSTSAMKEKLHAVIRQQLEAFRRDDYAAAYGFAAEGIKAQFSLAAFEKMVRTGYPLIAKSTEASFGISLDDGERAVVSVVIVSGEVSAQYQYLLERSGAEWKISGVEPLDEKSKVI